MRNVWTWLPLVIVLVVLEVVIMRRGWPWPWVGGAAESSRVVVKDITAPKAKKR